MTATILKNIHKHGCPHATNPCSSHEIAYLVKTVVVVDQAAAFQIIASRGWAKVFSIPHPLLFNLTDSRNTPLIPKNLKEIYK